MERVICLLIGYVCGLFQTSYFIGKLAKKDIREYGSGNAGTTNALRVLGRKAGAATLICDALKCIIAIHIVRAIFGESAADILPLLSIYAAFGTILGHNFPFYMGFKGGKGVATSLGACFCLNPLLGLYVLLIGVGTIAITRYVSVGSLAGSTSSIILFAFFDPNPLKIVLLIILTVSMYIRHHENLKRLCNHTENKISFKKKEEK